MLPESKHGGLVWALLPGNVQHTLPDTGQVTKIEDVVELGWSRKHLDLMLWEEYHRRILFYQRNKKNPIYQELIKRSKFNQTDIGLESLEHVLYFLFYKARWKEVKMWGSDKLGV